MKEGEGDKTETYASSNFSAVKSLPLFLFPLITITNLGCICDTRSSINAHCHRLRRPRINDAT